MPLKLLQLNTTANSGSTGRIAEDIGRVALANRHLSYIAYGTRTQKSESTLIRIGHSWDQKIHGFKTRLLDRHGFGSKAATESFIKRLDRIDPDIIQIHNLHGYYLHVGVLFKYLNKRQIPVIWTFHDCWPFTGHCTFFEHYDCERWKTLCHDCPNTRGYPASWWIDQSCRNYKEKKELFNSIRNLTIVTPSHWLGNLVRQSFLKDYPVRVIHNGVDLERFYPHPSTVSLKERLGCLNKKIILGVANTWDKRKGLTDFLQLIKLIDKEHVVVLVGLSVHQIAHLPEDCRIKGITRTENIGELCQLYSLADVFVNPTYLDNFPSTNIEALACGTPIITYKTGGSPEAVGDGCGFVVSQGNLEELEGCIKKVLMKGKDFYRDRCRKRAEALYDKNDRYQDYLNLYQNVLYRK